MLLKADNRRVCDLNFRSCHWKIPPVNILPCCQALHCGIMPVVAVATAVARSRLGTPRCGGSRDGFPGWRTKLLAWRTCYL